MQFWQKLFIATGFVLLVSSVGSCRQRLAGHITAIHVLPPSTLGKGDLFTKNDIPALLHSIPDSGGEITITSSRVGYVQEPPDIPGVVIPTDRAALGYGKSHFIAFSRWSIIRYVGDQPPAGAGLTGEELDKAQLAALGQADDSIPVVTAAWTIHRMMEDFFVPLLQTHPRGSEILSKFRIEGAYFSPHYTSSSLVLERDNAFLSGLQSLYIWPSSCFEQKTKPRNDCQPPFLSTGHDPTVIGHELGHAIFNHMRSGKTLDGFQWLAVNEGFADYFSAAYFADNAIGRVWRVGMRGNSYLRKFKENPNVWNKEALENAHAFGLVWSSMLWNIKERLVREHKASLFDIHRVYLFSIEHLGETTGVRLADAASALLKALTRLGLQQWESVFRDEFAKAQIELDSLMQSNDALAQWRNKYSPQMREQSNVLGSEQGNHSVARQGNSATDSKPSPRLVVGCGVVGFSP